MYKARRRSNRSSKALVSRAGNFHMALPLTMKLKLAARDSNIMAIGLGPYLSIDGGNVTLKYGPPTSTRCHYELFYPRGQYFKFIEEQPYNGLGTNKVTYPYGTAGSNAAQATVSLYPGQMEAFGTLYKYARVERVDFHVKFSNMGHSDITPTPISTVNSEPFSTGAICHTMAVLPKSQIDAWGFNSTVGPWTSTYIQSNSAAAQIAEIPGTTQLISSQDGNKEVVSYRKSIDLTQRMAGDSIRQRTWMSSNASQTGTAGTTWNFPAAQNDDPTLVTLGTSSLIDEYLQTRGQYTAQDLGPNGASGNNIWLRYNEQVEVTYHLTFWEPKTPAILL